MKLIKPNFWDYKRPNFLSYILLPFTLPILINNFFLNKNKNKDKDKTRKIKNICIGNIYLGGTGKTPLSIKINQILKDLDFNVAVVKKFYKDQVDEQALISKTSKLYCFKKRITGLTQALNDGMDIAIYDDGLQDKTINYDLSFVCFNSIKWIGNGFLIPAGPLREKITSISKYDAIFLNGKKRNNSELNLLIKKYNKNIKIFETYYEPTNIDQFISDKYLIFSGIGNPDSFKEILIKNKLNIVKEIIFPDHYKYSKKDINNIKKKAKDLDAKILTTEKDYVKINDNEIKFLKIDIIIRNENEFINFLKSKI